MHTLDPADALDPLYSPLELMQLYTVDAGGRCYWPRPDDPADAWVAVIAPAGRPRPGERRPLRVVWARPSMQALGAALGAAGLLGSRVILDQLARLGYPAVRGRFADQPPLELELLLLEQLA